MKEISLILKNVPGQLAEVADICAAEGINIRGMCVAETEHISLLRLVVDDLDAAHDALKDRFPVGIKEVVEVEVPNKPGALSNIAKVFAAAGVNIDYAYVAVAPDGKRDTLILRVDKINIAVQTLKEKHIRVY